MKPSKKLIQALKILRDDKPGTAAHFARLMWPDSLMHQRVTNCGNGARRGAGAWLTAGSYLGKLEKAGYILKRRHGDVSTDKPIATLTRLGIDTIQE